MQIKSGHIAPWSRYEERVKAKCDSFGYVFVGFAEKYKGIETRLVLRCSEGHEWSSTTIHAFLKNRPTRCTRCYRPTMEDYEAMVIKRCNEIGYTFLGFTGAQRGKLTKMKLRCSEGHEWSSTPITTFIGKAEVGCAICNHKAGIETKKKKAEDYIDPINERCKKLGYTFLGFAGEWKSAKKTKAQFICDHGHRWDCLVEAFLGNKNITCSSCTMYGFRPHDPASLYIQKLYKDGEFVAVKFGITNRKPEDRIKQQQLKSSLKHELFEHYRFNAGSIAQRIESEIKQKWAGKVCYMPRDIMPDGWTETLPASEFFPLLKTVRSMVNEAKINLPLAA